MHFDMMRFLWQIINLLSLIVIVALVFVIPVWVYKKVNSIEDHLKQLNNKLDVLVASKKESDAG